MVVNCNRRKTLLLKRKLNEVIEIKRIEKQQKMSMFIKESFDQKKKYHSDITAIQNEINIIESIINSIESKSDNNNEELIIKLDFSHDEYRWLISNCYDFKATFSEYIYWKFGILILIIIAAIVFVALPLLLNSLNISAEIRIISLCIILLIIKIIFR